jgi:hypothetical protein
MKNIEIIQKIKSVKYCLMAHPHNEEHSEFADRIEDLQEIEDFLSKEPNKILPKSGVKYLLLELQSKFPDEFGKMYNSNQYLLESIFKKAKEIDNI